MPTGQIYFRLPKTAKEYFAPLKFKYDFDYYYLCIIIGTLAGRIGQPDDVMPQYFVDSYPGPYKARRGIIAGLLIEAEMRRRDIRPSDRERVQQLILELTSNNDTFLSEEGADLLNLYAAGGLQIIQDKITRPPELATFLSHYYKLIHELEAMTN